jgi:hypothetical protein
MKPKPYEWASDAGKRRATALQQATARSAEGRARVYDTLFDATSAALFAKLAETIEASVKAFNGACKFPDVTMGSAGDSTVWVERRHEPAFTFELRLDRASRTIVVTSHAPPDPSTQTTTLPLQINADSTAIVCEQTPAQEVRRRLQPLFDLV